MDIVQVRIIIVITFIGFMALAIALLTPVYRFIRREEKRGEEWNAELKRQGRMPGEPSGDGAPPESVEGDERA